MRTNPNRFAQKTFFLLLLTVLMIQPLFFITPVLAGEIDEVDGFQNAPNFRWTNLSTTDSNIDESMEGDFLKINNTNSSGDSSNYTKTRRLNDRDMYFNSRFLLDLGRKNNVSEYFTDIEKNATNWNDGSTEGFYVNTTKWDIGVTNGHLQVSHNESQNLDEIIVHRNVSNLNGDRFAYYEIEYYFTSPEVGLQIKDFEVWNHTVYSGPGTIHAWDGTDVSNDTVYTSSGIVDMWENYGWKNVTIIGLHWDFNNAVYANVTLNINNFMLTTVENAVLYNDNDGFKFFLGNQQNGTAMEWEFLHDGSLNDSANYSLGMNIYNSTGSVIMESKEYFEYHYTTHGWLDFEVEWNIDTKRIRVRLTDSLATRIVDYRRIDDIFNVSQLITSFDYGWAFGKPTLGFNASVEDNGRCYVIIDYIDSNYDLMDWIDTYETFGASGTINIGSGTSTGAPDSSFTSANQWSVFSLGLEQDGTSDSLKKYYHDIDHFDEVSFDFTMNVSELELNDFALFQFYVYNIKHDGSAEGALRIDLECQGVPTLSDLFEARIYKRNGALWEEVESKYFGSSLEMTMAFELYYDDEKGLVYQSSIGSDNTAIERIFTNLKLVPYDSDNPWTKEFVLLAEYSVSTTDGGYSNDEVYFAMSGYDVVRKGLIGDIITGFVGILAGLFQFLLTPLIIAFMFLGGLIVKALQTLGKFLEPILGLITSAVEGVGGLIDSLGQLVLDIGSDVGTFLLTLVGDFINAAISWLISVATDFVDLIAEVAFIIWDDFFGFPDILAIIEVILFDFIFPIIVGIPGFILDLVGWLFIGGELALVGFWFYALFFGFASQGFRPFEGISEFIERMLKGPDITIVGVGPARVPIGLFVVVPLTMFIIIAPTNAFFFIW
jgi:hypothetical protein